MRKFSVTLTAAAALLLIGSLACKADVLTSTGPALSTATKNYTPVEPAACRGYGPSCGPGFTRVCGRYRCWCRPCY